MDRKRRSKMGQSWQSKDCGSCAWPIFPDADEIVSAGLGHGERSAESVDILLVNPPTPDGGLWIRTQHRVGRRTRENMVWPQVSLAQLAAILHPQYKVAIIDANAERMGWPDLRERSQIVCSPSII